MLVLIAILAAVPVAVWAARNGATWSSALSAAQPADTPVSLEDTVLDALVTHPGHLPRVIDALDAATFTGDRREDWLAIVAAARAGGVTPGHNRSGLRGRVSAAASRPDWPALFADAGVSPARIARAENTTPLSWRQLLRVGRALLEAVDGATLTGPGSPVTETADGHRTRHHVPTSPARRITFAAAAAAATILAIGTAVASTDLHAAAGAATVALVAVIAGGLIVAAVDADTLFVPTGVLAVTTAVGWSAATAAAAFDQDLGRLAAGAVCTVGFVVAFEVIVGLWRLVRAGGRSQGFGDTLLLPAFFGVPAAVTGSWELCLASLLVACTAAIVHVGTLIATGKMTRTDPFAFGPYLCFAWVGAIAAGIAGLVTLALPTFSLFA